MSWINDVRQEIRALDVSKRSLRKFGLSVGVVFSLITLWMIMKNQAPLFCAVFGVIGLLLIMTGLIYPQSLKEVYKIWMGLAFAIGWMVSRALLIGMFFFVLTPIGFIARLFKKEFMDVKFIKSRETFWVKKKIDKTINYEKMY